MTLPFAGQPGQGRTASLRRRPGSIVDGRMEGGNTGAFELVCGQCGDHPYLDYSEIPQRLQRILGRTRWQASPGAPVTADPGRIFGASRRQGSRLTWW